MMFELLVPPQKGQLDRLKGDKTAYDLELRPKLMVRAIEQLQDAGVEPDLWKIEGLDSREDCERIVAAARRGGRNKVSCIILGRGEDDKRVHEWLEIASSVPGFIGFAVGRTTFWEPVVDWRAGKLTREAAVAEVARRYQEFVRIFERAKRGGGWIDAACVTTTTWQGRVPTGRTGTLLPRPRQCERHCDDAITGYPLPSQR